MLPATWRRYPAETKQRAKDYSKKKTHQNRPEWYDKVCRLNSVARTSQDGLLPYCGHEFDVLALVGSVLSPVKNKSHYF